MDTMKVGEEKENVNLRKMEKTLYTVRDRSRRDENAKQSGSQAYFNSVRPILPVPPRPLCRSPIRRSNLKLRDSALKRLTP
jgi:hypothetical protein